MHRVFRLTVVSFLLLPRVALGQGGEPDSPAKRYRAATEHITAAALADSGAYRRLSQLTDRFGHRLSGSASLEAAIDWILAEMRTDSLDSVHAEPVLVPHWVRGAESAELMVPRSLRLHLLGLGGSTGTASQGITAPVLVVTSFEDLERHAADARGKIVLFDVPFPTTPDPFAIYGDIVAYRVAGASAAAKVGAVASLIRSIATGSMQSPHTGVMRYDSAVARIPHAALSVEDAELLHRMQDRGERPVVRLRMEARTLADAPSRNVIAELRGVERPEEVVVIGGHIDSWDVGQGAMDDGGGAVAAWEALRLLHRLGLRPRRTVRVVLWTNEENGGRGGTGYRDAHANELDAHVLAIESDNGVFAPRGFRYTGPSAGLEQIRRIGSLLTSVGAATVDSGPSEADVGPLALRGVPTLGLTTDPSRYFWYHHTDGDTVDKLDPREMAQCVAALAIMAYVVADMPDELPHGVGGGN